MKHAAEIRWDDFTSRAAALGGRIVRVGRDSGHGQRVHIALGTGVCAVTVERRVHRKHLLAALRAWGISPAEWDGTSEARR